MCIISKYCYSQNSFYLELPELTCVPGYRVDDWSNYLSSWYTRVSKGESISNRDDCWMLARQNVDNAKGIYWSFDVGFCRALVHYQEVLPWPTSFPDNQNARKLCIESHLVGKNGSKN